MIRLVRPGGLRSEAIHFGNDQRPSAAALRFLDALSSESVDAFNRNHWRLSPEYTFKANFAALLTSQGLAPLISRRIEDPSGREPLAL
jgi:hypothetical protein